MGYALPAIFISDGTEQFSGQNREHARDALDSLSFLDKSGAYPKFKVLEARALENDNSNNCHYEALVQSYFLYGVKTTKWYVTDCGWRTTDSKTLDEARVSR